MKQTKFKQTEIGEIPEDWRIVTIPDVASNFDNKRKPLSSAERSKIRGQYPYYGAAGIIDYVNDFKYEGNYLLIAEDGTVTSYGNRPMLQLARGKFWVSNHAHVLQCKSYKDTLFLYYQLKNTSVAPFITGAVQPKLSQENLNKIKFLWIENDDERGVITKILFDLDEKIELNHQMNKTLESIAQAIFKQWFVDFEFPNDHGRPYKSSSGKMVDSDLGEIPDRWEIKSLDKIADFLNGLALQKFPPKDDRSLPVIEIRELNQGITESSDKASLDIDAEYIVHDGDVLFSWSGSLQTCIWCHGEGALNQHLFKVTSSEYPKWFYFYWVNFHLPEFQQIAQGKATTMGHIQRHHLSASQVIVPPEEILKNMSETIAPLIDRVISNGVEIRRLSQIRDSLLPRLMSGKIRVN